MQRVTLKDLHRQPGRIANEAMMSPVVITRHGRDVLLIQNAATSAVLRQSASISSPFRDRRRKLFYSLCCLWHRDKGSPLYKDSKPCATTDFSSAFWGGFSDKLSEAAAKAFGETSLNYVAWRAGRDCAAQGRG
jgi:hypothetical protein